MSQDIECVPPVMGRMGKLHLNRCGSRTVHIWALPGRGLHCRIHVAHFRVRVAILVEMVATCMIHAA